MKDKLIAYLRGVREEMKKVTWPSRKQVIRDTLVVIGISVAFAVYFGIIDYGLTELLSSVL